MGPHQIAKEVGMDPKRYENIWIRKISHWNATLSGATRLQAGPVQSNDRRMVEGRRTEPTVTSNDTRANACMIDFTVNQDFDCSYPTVNGYLQFLRQQQKLGKKRFPRAHRASRWCTIRFRWVRCHPERHPCHLSLSAYSTHVEPWEGLISNTKITSNIFSC